jgi:hypothetical protein
MNTGTLAARALNNAWATHKPTYAALRLLLDSVKDEGVLLERVLGRRIFKRTSWRYFGFLLTKDIAANGTPNYRNCIVGSPLTLLAESHILAEMAKESAFEVPKCAYSYRWPRSPENGRNFEYYFDGYRKRNAAIATQLQHNRDGIAVVFDIKRFYPTIDTVKLRRNLESRLKTIADAERRAAIAKFTFGMLDLKSPVTSHGIPIGPDLSHVLGHVALADVDAEMSKYYGERYHRYVDDMIVVCDKGEAVGVQASLQKLLDRENLSLNDDKRDIVTAREWNDYSPQTEKADSHDVFELLRSRIVRYLIEKPDNGKALADAFRNEGFSIPVGRLGSLARSKRYHSYLVLKTIFNWLFNRREEPALSLIELTAYAKEVRGRYLLDLYQQSSVPLAPSSMRRRWQVQQWRRLVSRLIYLLSPGDFKSLLASVPNIEELAEARQVLTAIAEGDCTNLVDKPGRAISTFAQVWQVYGKSQPKLRWDAIRVTRPEAGALCDLAMMVSAAVPDVFSQSLAKQFPGTSLLLDLSRHAATPTERPIAQSYLDEVSLLMAGKDSQTIASLFTTRHDEREDFGLDALSLFGGMSGDEGPFHEYL